MRKIRVKTIVIIYLYCFVVVLLFLIQFNVTTIPDDGAARIAVSHTRQPVNSIENHSYADKPTTPPRHQFEFVEPFKRIRFDPQNNWLVFYHIQKTSGTSFDRHMMNHLEINVNGSWKKACATRIFENREGSGADEKIVTSAEFECKMQSSNESWILSWYEKHWEWTCGLHLTLSDLQSCIRDRVSHDGSLEKFHFFTFIREPLSRFISEWLHVKRTGLTWVFNDESVTRAQICIKRHLQKCMGKRTFWTGVSLNEFIACKWNMAFNRQTRMLAMYDSGFDLCAYLDQLDGNVSLMDEELLSRAKNNLKSISLFGLTEQQNLTLSLFEKTFDQTLRFDKRMSPKTNARKVLHNRHHYLTYDSTESVLEKLNESQHDELRKLNYLDIKLYQYACELFFYRLKKAGIAYYS